MLDIPAHSCRGRSAILSCENSALVRPVFWSPQTFLPVALTCSRPFVCQNYGQEIQDHQRRHELVFHSFPFCRCTLHRKMMGNVWELQYSVALLVFLSLDWRGSGSLDWSIWSENSSVQVSLATPLHCKAFLCLCWPECCKYWPAHSSGSGVYVQCPMNCVSIAIL